MTDSKPYRILVTGSRTWGDERTIWDALTDAIDQAAADGLTEFVVVHGDCPRGADAIADFYCEDQAGWRDNMNQVLAVERYPADWATCTPACSHGNRTRHDGTRYCPSAGPRRNQAMVDLGADICLAFQVGDSKGTADCIRRAEKAGIPVRRYERSSG